MGSTLIVDVVSYGHTDVSLDWCKALLPFVDVRLTLVFSKGILRESAVELARPPRWPGWVGRKESAELLDGVISGYLGESERLRLFYYPAASFKDPRCLAYSYHLARGLTRRRPDLIHFSGNNVKQWQVSWFLGRTPRLHTIHDYEGHSGERQRVAEWFNRRLARRERLLVHSRSVAERLRCDFPGARVSVVPFGPLNVYRAFSRSGGVDLPQAGYALFFGRISTYKGLGTLLGAFRRIRHDAPSLRLVVAGGGEWGQVLKQAEGLEGCEFIQRHLANAELATLIEGALFVVCPYTDATQSGVVMTAYAFGKPVIATRVGGLQEVVHDGVTGLLVPPGDEEKLGEAMRRIALHADRVEAHSRGIAALTSAGALGWKTIAESACAVYTEASGA